MEANSPFQPNVSSANYFEGMGSRAEIRGMTIFVRNGSTGRGGPDTLLWEKLLRIWGDEDYRQLLLPIQFS